MKVQDKIIVVTGGGNEIGRDIIFHLLERGNMVVAVDHDKSILQEARSLRGIGRGFLTTIIADITNKAAVEQLLQMTLSIHGAVDGLINNAGIIQPFNKIDELSHDCIDQIFRVNLQGTLNMIKAFLPHLMKRREAHIVNVSSMSGFLPVAGQAIYGASKAAIKIISESLTLELMDTGVEVTTVIQNSDLNGIKAKSGLGKAEDINDTCVTKETNLTLPSSIAAQMIIAAMEQGKKRLFVGNDSKHMNLLQRLGLNFALK